MIHSKIDSSLMELMLTNGYNNLAANQEEINELNVFPVPDGDTGINMSMTMNGGIKTFSNADTVSKVLSDFSHGMLFAARGNSGVIFSQFIRGFADGAKGVDEMSVSDFVRSMNSGVKQAYKSVAKPVEGTMLTVMREASDFLDTNYKKFDSYEKCFAELLPAMQDSLSNTPQLLPVLKEAGVIDSGGAGLIKVFEGMSMALDDRLLDDYKKEAVNNAPAAVTSLPDNGKMTYGYCTEFILQLMFSDKRAEGFELEKMIEKLETIGDSIVAIRDENIVKVHIHTFTPEVVLAYAHTFGEFLTLKIENMSVQHNQKIKEEVPENKRKKFSIAAVLSGEGIKDYFIGIGTDAIINGGQTDNPSIEEFIKAFDTINAENIIVLPNNSNVILAAKQAAKLYKKSKVFVIETKSIAEGYSALSMMNNSVDTPEELIESMTSNLSYVTTGYITTSTRDCSIGGIEVKKDNYIGLDNETIRSSSDDINETIIGLLKNIPDIVSKEVITGFYGSSVSLEQAEMVKMLIEKEFPFIECGLIEGKMPVYDYIFAIE